MMRNKRHKLFTLHLSMLTNSTCLPPHGDLFEDLGIPNSSRTSANFAPPQTAAHNMYKGMKVNINRKKTGILKEFFSHITEIVR